MISKVRPVRVLQVVGAMNRGGVETWLMHVLRHIDRNRFAIDFLVHTDHPCAYDDEIRSLGSRVVPCLIPSRPWTYARNFRRILAECGPFDVVHSHVHHFSGFVLKQAAAGGVPVRIAHSHNDTSRIDAHSTLLRRAYLRLGKEWIRRHATNQLACSSGAAECLYGKTWRERAAQVLFCGIDLAPYEKELDRGTIRAELGIPRDAFVIGHVGRFSEQKNHAFLIDVAGQLLPRVPNVYFLLVGDGKLRSAIEQRVTRAGQAGHWVFAGVRPDVPRVLRAMDVFLFPSRWEGMPLSLVEAQAAGLQCFVSDVITREAHAVAPLVKAMSLGKSPEEWGNIILAGRNTGVCVGRSAALSIIENGPFNIHASVRSLERVYDGQ